MGVTAATLAFVALLSCPRAHAATESTGSRQLLQSGAPACFYLEQQKTCVPSSLNMMAVPVALQPSDILRKAYLMALDRSDLCSRTHIAESACWADATNRCFWHKVDSPKGICLSADYAEITAFERSGYVADLATIPSSMTCPGSKAAHFFTCYAHPAPDACSKLSGCAADTTQGKPVCLPQWAARLDKEAASALAHQIQNLDPAIFGYCEAACWLKQARTWTGVKDQASCPKNPQCGYNPVAKMCNKVPVAKSGKDAYDDKLNALMSTCSKLTDKATCAGKTIKLEQAGKWASWQATATAAKC